MWSSLVLCAVAACSQAWLFFDDTTTVPPTTTQTANQAVIAFEPNFGYEMVKFSSAAYQENPLPFLKVTFPEKQFDSFSGKQVDCNLFTTCFAFVAREKASEGSTGPGAVFVSFRGTNAPQQLLQEAMSTVSTKSPSSLGKGMIFSFFQEAHARLWPTISELVRMAVNGNPLVPVYVTGHSLGGALASLTAAQLVHEKIVDQDRLFVTTFGQPRTGDYEFAELYNSLVPKTLRIVHYRDVIPHAPVCSVSGPCEGNDFFYYHHGIEVFYPEEKMTVDSEFRICLGEPKNEDEGCSNGVIGDNPCLDMWSCVDDHLRYYDLEVGTEVALN